MGSKESKNGLITAPCCDRKSFLLLDHNHLRIKPLFKFLLLILFCLLLFISLFIISFLLSSPPTPNPTGYLPLLTSHNLPIKTFSCYPSSSCSCSSSLPLFNLPLPQFCWTHLPPFFRADLTKRLCLLRLRHRLRLRLCEG